MKAYSDTIKSLLNDKMMSKGISLTDVTYFEFRGQVHFYWGSTLLLSTYGQNGPTEEYYDTHYLALNKALEEAFKLI